MQNAWGPYHIIPVAKLHAYLNGHIGVAHEVSGSLLYTDSRVGGEASVDAVGEADVLTRVQARVHGNGRWIDSNTFSFTASCCGDDELMQYQLDIRRLNTLGYANFGALAHMGWSAVRVQSVLRD